jgi:hypothetical protein
MSTNVAAWSDDIRSAIQSAQPLGRRRICGRSLFEQFEHAHPDEDWSVRDATVDFGKTRIKDKAWQASLSFVECSLHGTLSIERVTFAGRLELQDVRCDARLALREFQVSQSVRFERVLFRSGFDFRLACKGNADAPEASAEKGIHIVFGQCEFLRECNIEPCTNVGELTFPGSVFHVGCNVTLWSSQRAKVINLSRALVAGRVSIVDAPDVRGTKGQPAWCGCLTALGAVVTGTVCLRDGGVRLLDLREATFGAGGAMICTREQIALAEESTLPTHLRFISRSISGAMPRAGDYLGHLDGRPHRRPYDLERLGSSCADVADQYERLSDAFATLPSADEEEDECHYRCHFFRLVRDVVRIGPRKAFIALALLISWSILLVASLIACPRDEVCVLLALVVPTAYAAAACARRASWARALFVVSNAIVLYGMLGYGVCVLRVLGTAGVLIVLFALICGLMSAYYPEHGVLLQADPETTLVANAITGKRYFEGATPLPGAATATSTAEPLPGNPRPWELGIKIQRALYFSTVSFTTLGYGDFRPAGRLQVVAAVEVSLGAVLIALLTVVFARRFLRV